MVLTEIRPIFTLFVVDSGTEMRRLFDRDRGEGLFDQICRTILNYVDIKLSFKAGNQFSLAHFDDSGRITSCFDFTDDRGTIDACIQTLQRQQATLRRQHQSQQQALSEPVDALGFSFSSIFSWLGNIMVPSKLLVRIIVINVRMAEPFVDANDRMMHNFMADKKNCLIDFINVTDDNSPDGSAFSHALWDKVYRLGNIELFDTQPESVCLYNQFARLLPHPDFQTGHSHENPAM